MTDYELKNIAPEDIEDLILKVESSFDITFAKSEMAHIKTFGEMCDHITGKIQLDNLDDCTTQQAFYLLRNGVSKILHLDKTSITIKTKLADILPRKGRKFLINLIEEELNIKLNLVRPPYWVTSILFLTSLASLFFSWKIGVWGFGISIVGFWLSEKLGNELDLQTIEEVVRKMARENYLKVRRNPKTVNKEEIEQLLVDLFANDLDLDKSKLTREKTFA